jgi:hypothetical protein
MVMAPLMFICTLEHCAKIFASDGLKIINVFAHRHLEIFCISWDRFTFLIPECLAGILICGDARQVGAILCLSIAVVSCSCSTITTHNGTCGLL